jgi:hypothetical protein
VTEDLLAPKFSSVFVVGISRIFVLFSIPCWSCCSYGLG